MDDPAILAKEAIARYEFETKPYAHQLEALHLSCFLPEYGLLMDMGTGKTKVILDNACILFEEYEIGALLVIAPNSVYRNWILREIPKHVPLRIQKVMRSFVHKRDRPERLTEILDTRPLFNLLLFNVEAFSSREDLVLVLSAWMQLMPTMMVIDESTMIKSWKSKRTKNIIKLGKAAKYRRIATGLVAPHGPMDVFPQFQFLKPGSLGTTNPIAFKSRFCVTVPINAGGQAIDKIIGVQNQAELQNRMGRISYRKRKDECLDLPRKIYNFHYSELDKETRMHYERMRTQAIFELEHENPEDSIFVRNKNRISMIMRLQMISCGHIKDEEGVSHRFSWTRINDTVEFLETVEGQVVVWAVHVKDVQDLTTAIKKAFGKDSVRSYYGATSILERDEALNDFQSGKLKYLVANPATGRFGNTMTASHTALYYSNSHHLEYRLQSEDRIHRIGQSNTCLYVDILAPNTVNLPMIQNLRKKIDTADAISGDGYRNWLINRKNDDDDEIITGSKEPSGDNLRNRDARQRSTESHSNS